MGNWTRSTPPNKSDHYVPVDLDTGIGALTAEYIRTGTGLISKNERDTARDAILKCCGIKYADIPFRWASPRATGPWEGSKDCTQFGPGCPQVSEPLFNVDDIPLFGRMGKKAISIQPEKVDELNCLNLNIWAPVQAKGSAIINKKNLPVLVWVHGGSYQVGAGGVNLYDGTQLVKRSIELESPIIFVTFNYRVGILGFFHSAKLATEALRQTECSPCFRSSANLGLQDSHMAFDWVKKYIHHFGGDPNNITGIGESAGAGTLHYLALYPGLHPHIPRMIFSSSTCFSVQLLRSEEAELWFHRVCDRLGIPPDSSDVVHHLQDIDIDDLITRSSFALSAFRPIWDNITITFDPREIVRNCSLWDGSLRTLVKGVCKNEPFIRHVCYSNKKPDIQKVINGRVPPGRNLRERALGYYGNRQISFDWFNLGPGSVSNDIRAVAFEGHARYYSPARQVSDSFTSSKTTAGEQRVVYRYICNWATSHWRADWPVTHTADILPTFLHPSLSAKEKEMSYTLADRIIGVAAGNEDNVEWQRYTKQDRAINEWGDDGKWKILKEDETVFNLTDETKGLWDEIIQAILETGFNGWADMIR